MNETEEVRDTERAPPPSSVTPPISFPRDRMPTLPDGVPSELWDEAVESERRMTIPAPPSWSR